MGPFQLKLLSWVRWFLLFFLCEVFFTGVFFFSLSLSLSLFFSFSSPLSWAILTTLLLDIDYNFVSLSSPPPPRPYPSPLFWGLTVSHTCLMLTIQCTQGCSVLHQIYLKLLRLFLSVILTITVYFIHPRKKLKLSFHLVH